MTLLSTLGQVIRYLDVSTSVLYLLFIYYTDQINSLEDVNNICETCLLLNNVAFIETSDILYSVFKKNYYVIFIERRWRLKHGPC